MSFDMFATVEAALSIFFSPLQCNQVKCLDQSGWNDKVIGVGFFIFVVRRINVSCGWSGSNEFLKNNKKQS